MVYFNDPQFVPVIRSPAGFSVFCAIPSMSVKLFTSAAETSDIAQCSVSFEGVGGNVRKFFMADIGSLIYKDLSVTRAPLLMFYC